MKVLVTGSLGFIGRHVVDALLEGGDTVMGVDRRRPVRHPAETYGLITYQVDVSERDMVDWLGEEQPEGIVHLAAEASIALGVKNPDRMVRSNVTGTVNVVDLARRLDVPIVLASSAAVYGDTEWGETPTVESFAMPTSLYGWTKAWGEQYARQYENATMLRLSNVFGPGQYRSAESGVIGKWVRAAARHESLHLYGDGTQIRDFVPVSLVVGRIVEALAIGRPRTPVWNVSSGRGRSLNSVLDDLRKRVPDLDVVSHPDRDPGARWSVLEPSFPLTGEGEQLMFVRTLDEALEHEQRA